jgi:hypothetical protein
MHYSINVASIVRWTGSIHSQTANIGEFIIIHHICKIIQYLTGADNEVWRQSEAVATVLTGRASAVALGTHVRAKKFALGDVLTREQAATSTRQPEWIADVG